MQPKWIVATLFLIVTLVGMLNQSVVVGDDNQRDNVVTVSNTMPYLNIAPRLQQFEDLGGQWRIDDLISPGATALFESPEKPYINHGYKDSIYWFRVVLENPDQEALDLLLEFTLPLLDYIDGYLVTRDNQEANIVRQFRLGDRYPFAQRPIVSSTLLQPIRFDGAQIELYLRVQSHSPVILPVYLSGRNAYAEHTIVRQWFNGLIYGIAIALMFYNLVLFATLRDRMYLYYTLFTGCLFMVYACIDGIAYRLWPTQVEWQSKAHLYFVFAAVTFAVMFAGRFLNIDRSMPQLYRNVRALVWLNVAGLLCTPWLLEKYAAYVMSLATGFTLVFLFCVGLKRLRDGIPLAGLYVLIYGLLIISAFLNVVASQGILMNFTETHSFMKIASVVELMLLSIGVGYQITVIQNAQIRAERRARQFAQEARSAEQKALQIEREANRTLEDKVQERTAQLEDALADLHAANAQLKRLSELDPLTGLYNRRKFEASLREMMEKALADKSVVTFFFIDIDHFKRFNDTYGHDVGDECLKQVARLLRKLGDRYGMIVGRLGGEEFAAIAYGAPDQAPGIGEAIRAEIERHRVMMEGKELCVTVSIGGHTAGHYQPDEKSVLMKVADEALYRAKEQGRNQVVMADTPFGNVPAVSAQ